MIYSTKEIVTYAVSYDENETLSGPDVKTRVLVGNPPKILGLIVQNDGKASANDVLVRIPFTAADGYAGGWMRRADRPITNYMKDGVHDYKFEKLVPGESVSFYIYLKNQESDLAERIEVFDGFGARAAYYPYRPMRGGGDRLYFSVPKWLYYLYIIAFLVFVTPDVAGALSKAKKK